MKQTPDPLPSIAYSFIVQAEDGESYEVVVQDDGLAFRRPIAEQLDEDTGYVELRQAS